MYTDRIDRYERGVGVGAARSFVVGGCVWRSVFTDGVAFFTLLVFRFRGSLGYSSHHKLVYILLAVL